MSLNKKKYSRYYALRSLAWLFEFFLGIFGRAFIVISLTYIVIVLCRLIPLKEINFYLKLFGYGIGLLMLENFLNETVIVYFDEKLKMYSWVKNFKNKK